MDIIAPLGHVQLVFVVASAPYNDRKCEPLLMGAKHERVEANNEFTHGSDRVQGISGGVFKGGAELGSKDAMQSDCTKWGIGISHISPIKNPPKRVWLFI
nr:hypothetical protein [Xenorhabdus yunnanensis]